MRTEKQRETSRLNSLKSTGPRTPEGKAASSKNSFKLGICLGDAAFYDDPESRTHLRKLLADYEEFYQPQSPFERDCLEEIALCRVRLARLRRVEDGLFTEGRLRVATQTIDRPDGKPVRSYDLTNFSPKDRPVVADMHLAAAWRPSHDQFESLSRQQTRIANRLTRAEKRFDELCKTRPQPTDPEPDAAPVLEPATEPATSREPALAPPSPKTVVWKNEAEPALTPVVPTSASSPDPDRTAPADREVA